MTNLYPGFYYLKPLLKEYAFENNAMTLEVVEGSNEELVLEATRVAFSAFGVVSSLSGKKEKALIVQAEGEDVYLMITLILGFY